MTKYKLTTQQKNIWNLQKYYSDSSVSNICGTILYEKERDKWLLKKAVEIAAISHPALRVRFTLEEEPQQYISEEPVSIETRSFATEEEQDAYAERIAREPMELTDSCMCFFTVFNIGNKAGIIAKLNHLIADAWTLSLIADEVNETYERLAANAEEKETTTDGYLAHLESGEEYLRSARYEKDKAYWEEKYRAKPDETHIKLMNQADTGIEAKRITKEMSGELAEKIALYCEERNETEAVLLESAVLLYLIRINQENSNCTIGVPILNRNKAAEKRTAGMFISTMPLTVSIGRGATVRELIEKTDTTNREMLRHQRYPYEEILQDIRRKHEYSGSLYEVMVSIQNSRIHSEEGFRTKWYTNGYSEVPITISIDHRDREDGYIVTIDYQTRVFTQEEEVDILYNRIEYILRQLTEVENERKQIREISIIPEKEREKLLEEFNDTKANYPNDRCIHELFREQARREPEKTALVFEGRKFSYKELDEKSNALANYLREKGIRRNEVVPVIAQRDWRIIVAMLGVLKAGGAYMPVSPEYPEERIRTMEGIAQSRISLTYEYEGDHSAEGIDIGKFDFSTETGEIGNVNDSEDLCYIVFTSGSTGEPKGVCIKHENIVNTIKWRMENYHINDRQIVSIVSFTTDTFTEDILYSLLSGTVIYLIKDSQDGNTILSYLASTANSSVMTTPTFFSTLVSLYKGSYLCNEVILVGEQFDAATRNRLLAYVRFIHNEYGPSECAVCATYKNVSSQQTDVTIGKPISNVQIYILGEEQELLPIGVAGELCIAGAGVGKGYLNRPELTAERFIRNPYATEENGHGKVLYRTGDLARWKSDGEIEYLGRIDTQVKIRGLRIELGEIEGVMGQVEGIDLVAAAAKTDESGRQYLVGYYKSEKEIDEKALRERLSEKLPKYMVPNYFMRLKEMPMTLSGKIDRKRLPEIDVEEVESEADYVEPEGEIEKLLAGLMEQVLNYSPIGRDDDFFELGGDSLKAIELIAVLENKGYSTDIKTLFTNPTVRSLAQKLNSIKPRLNNNEASEDIPATAAQLRVYTAQALLGGTAYNAPYVFRTESVDPERLQKAVQGLINRHESLRTYFEERDGILMQVVEPNTSINIEKLCSDDITSFIRPFDLNKAPLIRVGYFKNTVMIDMHHIITDGNSMPIFFKELNELYMGRELKNEPVQYRQFALQPQDYTEDEKYWLSEFADLPPAVELNTDFKRKQEGDNRGSVLYGNIPLDFHRDVQTISRKMGITPYVFYLGAFYILLSKFSGNEDITVGIPMSGREGSFLQTIGMFVNTVVLRAKPEGLKTIEQFLLELREVVVNAMEHQRFPFNELVKKLGLNTIESTPLFNNMFAYQDEAVLEIRFADKPVSLIPVPITTAKYDFVFSIMPRNNDDLVIMMDYNSALYKETTIERFIVAYKAILSQMLNTQKKIQKVSGLDDREYQRLIGFNNTLKPYPNEKCIHELFEQEVIKSPSKIALIMDNQAVTYKQLNEKANRIAHGLIAIGIGTGDIVAFMLPRSIDLVAVILGIIKSGAAYLPIDLNYPEKRIEFMLSDSHAKFNITEKTLDSLICNTCVENPCIEVSSKNNCYCIYTSGSTGQPKGVLIKHQGIVNLVSNLFVANNSKRYDRIGLMTTITFDVASQEIFSTLLQGNTGVILPSRSETTIDKMIRNIVDNQVDVIYATPTYFKALTDTPERTDMLLNTVKKVVLAGEVFDLSESALNSKHKKNVVFENQYGPAETHVVTMDTFTGDLNNVTIGKPIANTQIYIVDKYMQLVPTNVIGELCIAGDGVGSGYLNRPDMTDEKFVDNPFGEGKLYKTGDLAYWRYDGKLVYVGRNDFQVKIRGLRIELGEIENAISAIEGITQAVVVVQKDENNRQLICAFYSGEERSAKEIRGIVKNKLPKYMLPHIFTYLNEMPLTSSGKIDRKRLPEVKVEEIENETDYIQPEGEIEKLLASLMEQVLNYSPIGRDDDFFELGGDSLKAIEFVSLAHQNEFAIELQKFFENSTIRKLSAHINKTNESSYFSFDDKQYDYYNQLLRYNCKAIGNEKIGDTPIGNLLLTGATGFLGAHLLADYLEYDTGNVYCLVRGNTIEDSKNRLVEKLEFYFGDKFIYNDRIHVLCADIQKEHLGLSKQEYDHIISNVNTVINAAAVVKHYGSYEFFYDINVSSVKRLVDFCDASGSRLIHISTTGIFNNVLNEETDQLQKTVDKEYNETDFYVGQSLDNVYSRSKFEAEAVVLEAVSNGLSAKIMRMGNLTNRYSDGAFQANYDTNAFLNRIKAFLILKALPESMLSESVEFTPIDDAAKAVMTISRHASENQTVFHVKNTRLIALDHLVAYFNDLGYEMRVISDDDFYSLLMETAKGNSRNSYLNAFISEMDQHLQLTFDNSKIDANCTEKYLRNLGFEWHKIDSSYISRYVKYFEAIGYFNLV